MRSRRVEVHGIRVGGDAAAALVARHPDDGINAPVPKPHDEPLEPGEWRPTPPAMTPGDITENNLEEDD